MLKINVTLVNQHVLTLYQLIPNPVCYDNDCIYVKSNHNYLAAIRSKELYLPYDEIDQICRKHALNFLLCPEFHSSQPCNNSPIFEIVLFKNRKEVPESCNIMYVTITASIFHKLKFELNCFTLPRGRQAIKFLLHVTMTINLLA